MAETNVLDGKVEQKPMTLDSGLRVRLSVMMFLQYAIWGLWMPILGVYLGGLPAFQLADGKPNLGLISYIYMTLPIASIIGPFIGGQIADRYFAAQRFLAVSQFLGGAILLLVARFSGFWEVFIGMMAYTLVYAPTIGISNSITFQHWPNDRFGKIRIWGSIGWIVLMWCFGLVWMDRIGPWFCKPTMVHAFYFAAGLSFVYGILALSLPHTPPSKTVGNPLAFLEAVRMMRVPAFAVMAVISFVVAIELQLYFALGGNFLQNGLGIAESRIGPALTLGQICEALMMIPLPFLLRKIGFRMTMALGIAAWAVRDLVFSIGQPTALVIGALPLHGVGFAFFFTTIFMFADVVAPKDIKSSAQSFLASLTFGCGMLVGSLLAGPISNACQNNWGKIFMVPSLLCAVCCLVFLVCFRYKPAAEKAA